MIDHLDAMQSRFERLLFREAAMLDDGDYASWIDLLHDDLRYWAPVRVDLERKDEDFKQKHLMCHIDDDKAALKLRVKRLGDGLSYTESPKPRVRHLITNILVVDHSQATARVSSNFIIFRSHVGLADHFLVGAREDEWVDSDGWKLRNRMILLDQMEIPGMAVLF